jgi:hypothetical protein
MFGRLLPLLALVLLLLAFWPNASSLSELTGEEDLAGQLRGLVQWPYTALRPQPNLAADVVPAEAPRSLFGMNTFLEQEVLPEVREQTVRLLADAGFTIIRQEFPWEDIEIHAKGDFIDRRNDPAGVDAWAKYDHIVALAGEYDLEILARLDNPPAWSRVLTDTIGTHGPPDNLDDYGDFVAAVAGRYRGQITYFQIWNEPNIYPEWGERPVDPEAFTELLCTGYRRVKAANPEAVVVAAALSPTIALDGRDLNDLIFLQRMYRAGAGTCFDILSAQGYGLFSGPADRRLRPTVINYPHVLYLRDVMVANGDAGKPIWISEVGWNAVPAGMADPYGRVDPEQQARYAVDAYRRARVEWPFVQVVNYWFLKRPSAAEQDQPWYYFRIMEPDFTPQPAWPALAAYATGPEAAGLTPQAALFFRWSLARPWLALAGGALLFFWLLTALAPPRPAGSAS